DFHLDKDTESAFSRFQSGINLLKQDKKLFKGLFYIAIKDVDTSDVEDLIQEFNDKISQICSKSQDNFILKMYGGKVEIAAMAPYNRSDYYRESLRELAETVEDRIDSCYDNGSTFLRDLKLIIAQIAAKDWTSIDSKRVAVIVDILRRNLMCGVHMGCLSANANEELQVFVNFDTQEEIPDFPVVVEDLSCDIKDSGLYLTPTNDSSISVTIRDVLSQIRSRLEMVLPRKGTNGEVWHSIFENLLEALSDRRHDRVQQWISSNTMDFRDNDEVQRLQLEANVVLGKVKQGLSVCGCKCSVCFWRCVLEKGHRDDHSCMGSHSCAESCSYCAQEREGLNICKDLAGHEGSHDCKEKNHTCRKTCHLFEMSSNCNELCSLRPEHPGQHKCNSPQHTCKTKCSLPSCNNPCAVPIESDHTKHQCHERYCPIRCTINGCSRTCGVKDHFHDWNPDAEHLCGNEHACPNECEMPGICEIFTELVRQTRVFQGQRGSFESGSMQSSDISPTMAKFSNHNSRLGCVYEAILRFIQARLRTVSDDSVSVVLFDDTATMAVEMGDMEEGVVDRLLQHYPCGGTTYSAGLDGAEKILMKGARHHTVDVKKPVVVFLSDGGNNGGGDPLYYVDKMKRQEPRMTLHTIMFGRDPTMHILVEMAKKGGGTFEQTLDEIQLARSFENLAESLKPKVAALM
ncbi:hypothetical protein KI387_033352, partial [Taxus chinensis]